ncbi:MAG: DUF5675 family protein [Clostridia bacterium]|nr:DUF5675 family protein [Clostridia bacterium]
MKTVEIRRQEAGEDYVAGKLFIAGCYFCDTLEDRCRDLNHNGRFDNGERKVYGETAIPCGIYDVTFETTTLGIGKRAKGGLIPLVHDVPDFTGIRIHQGNTPKDTSGCILLGVKSGYGKIINSTDTCLRFYDAVGYEPFKLVISDDFEL